MIEIHCVEDQGIWEIKNTKKKQENIDLCWEEGEGQNVINGIGKYSVI